MSFNNKLFIDETILFANKMFLDISLTGGKNSLPNSIQSKEASNNIKNTQDLLKSTNEIIEGNISIKKRICEGLGSVSSDLTEITKIVAAALIPFALNNPGILPLNSLVFAAIGLIVFNSGVKSFCTKK